MTLLIFAAIQVAICLPLHALVLPTLSGRGPVQSRVTPTTNESARQATGRRLYLLGGAFAAALFVFGAISVHLLNLLQVGGLTTAQAVMVASVIGPMQVTGRALELFFAKRLPPATVGLSTIPRTTNFGAHSTGLFVWRPHNVLRFRRNIWPQQRAADHRQRHASRGPVSRDSRWYLARLFGEASVVGNGNRLSVLLLRLVQWITL